MIGVCNELGESGRAGECTICTRCLIERTQSSGSGLSGYIHPTLGESDTLGVYTVHLRAINADGSPAGRTWQSHAARRASP